MSTNPDGHRADTGLLRRRRRSLLDLLALTTDPGEMSLAVRAAGLASRELANKINHRSTDKEHMMSDNPNTDAPGMAEHVSYRVTLDFLEIPKDFFVDFLLAARRYISAANHTDGTAAMTVLDYALLEEKETPHE